MEGSPRTPSVVNRVPVGELSLAVTEYEGNGPTLLLLHGIGSSGASWWPVIDSLAERFRLIVPDWRGHGASDKPDRGYLVPDYAADLAALIDAYGLVRPLIMGHSLGGMITLEWARRHPDRALRLVIEDSPLRRHPDVRGLFDGWIALASQSVEATSAYYAREYPNWAAAECRRRAETITSTSVAVFTELRDHNLQDDGADRIAPFRAIQSPTLLVYGDVGSGGMVPAEDAARFAATLPNATTVRIPGGTHSLHRDSADRFLEIVVPFLDGA